MCIFCFVFPFYFQASPAMTWTQKKMDFVTAARLASSYRDEKIQLHKDKNGDPDEVDLITK